VGELERDSVMIMGQEGAQSVWTFSKHQNGYYFQKSKPANSSPFNVPYLSFTTLSAKPSLK